jgi:hypothetical protein
MFYKVEIVEYMQKPKIQIKLYAFSFLFKEQLHFLQSRFGGVDWIRLAQDRYRWRALVNTVMNLQVP